MIEIFYDDGYCFYRNCEYHGSGVCIDVMVNRKYGKLVGLAIGAVICLTVIVMGCGMDAYIETVDIPPRKDIRKCSNLWGLC